MLSCAGPVDKILGLVRPVSSWFYLSTSAFWMNGSERIVYAKLICSLAQSKAHCELNYAC